MVVERVVVVVERVAGVLNLVGWASCGAGSGTHQPAFASVAVTCCALTRGQRRHISMVQVGVSGLGVENVGSSVADGVF